MPQEWITKNGKRIPLGKKTGGTTVVAGVLAVGVASGGFGVGGAGLSGTAADSALSSVLRAKVTNGKSAARAGKQQKAWNRLGLKRARKAVRDAVPCAVNSYGEVREFFLRTPCRSLDRMLVPLADDAGNTFLVSVVWVRMRGSSAAARLRELADTDGTGNVTALGGIGPTVGDVRFTGEHYDSTRRRSLTVISEAAPDDGSPAPALLQAATEVAVELPPP